MSNLPLLMTRCMAALVLAVIGCTVHAADAPRILVVVSSEGRDAGKTRPGFEMDEFAQAYLILRDNGFAIDVASPAGGKVEADRYNAKDDANAQLLADADAMRMLTSTIATRDVDASRYAAALVIGGKGAMFDLPSDRALQGVLSAIHERGGTLAAVCHGPAALVDVRLRDGSLLVAGRSLTGFSNEEETVFGKRWAAEFRFLLEDAMRERGARWHEAPLMMPKLVVDGRLITGQNPFSTPAVAEAIVRASGRTPKTRRPWRDEASLALVERLLAGPADAAHAELAANRDSLHVELIGLLGYYRLQGPLDDAAVREALAIMQLAEPYMPAPQLQLGIAEAQWRLGDAPAARLRIAKVLEAHPDMQEATRLLARTHAEP